MAQARQRTGQEPHRPTPRSASGVIAPPCKPGADHDVGTVERTEQAGDLGGIVLAVRIHLDGHVVTVAFCQPVSDAHGAAHSEIERELEH